MVLSNKDTLTLICITLVKQKRPLPAIRQILRPWIEKNFPDLDPSVIDGGDP